jgi:hypothetical protein
MAIAPAHLVAISLGFFGLALVVAAFVGETFAALRLFGGIGLLVAAMITSGVQLLSRHGAITKGAA